MRPATQAIHGGFTSDPATGATAVPIYQSAAYEYASTQGLADIFSGAAPGYVYTRIANPTTTALEQRLAQLEAGLGCIATASGMAAIAAVSMGLLRSGDEILCARGIFGGTVSLFKNVLGRFGVKTQLVNAGDSDACRQVISPATRMIFVETITNPTMDVPDLGAIAQIARENHIPLVVDATATTPALARVKELGADIIVHSTTKFINGHGTAIGGAIIDTGNYDWRKSGCREIRKLAEGAGEMAFLAYLRNVISRDLGGCPAPQNSFLMLQGLETLSYRMKAHCENARRLAEFLEQQPSVAWVNYPGLKKSKYYELVRKQYGGKAGAILTFGLQPGEQAFACMDRFRLAKRMTNLGDTRTLVLHPASTIFAEYSPEQRQAMGITDGMIRVSVGIEDFEDICADFSQAIKQDGRDD